MPTYEYECKHCAYSFEVFQSMSDEPLKKCPKCGKEVRRLIFGGAGVIFKGSGFYVTDNNKKQDIKKSRSEAKTPETAETKKSSGSAANSDAQKTPVPAETGLSSNDRPKSTDKTVKE